MLWATETVITADTVRQCLLNGPTQTLSILERPLGNGFHLRSLLDDVAGHYLDRAMTESHGGKAKAAALLGFDNYQTLNNWLKRRGNGTESA